jgi:hypothetical protein
MCRRFETEGVTVQTDHKAKAVERENRERILLCENNGEDVRLPFEEFLIAAGGKASASGPRAAGELEGEGVPYNVKEDEGMGEKTFIERPARLFLFLAVMGLAACANGANGGKETHITDRTGERWDISQAAGLGFQADRFQYGIGRHAFTPLDDSDLSDDTSSVSPSERVIGVANKEAAHAYSVTKLRRHEIANTHLGNSPIAVGY